MSFRSFRFACFVLAAPILAVAPLGCLPTEPEEEAAPAPVDGGSQMGEIVPATIQSLPGDATASTEDLVAEWRKLVETPIRSQMSSRHLAITKELATRGPEALNPMLDVIADADEMATRKVFSVASLSQVMRPEHLDRLKAMMAPDAESTTRACAASLISSIRDMDVTPHLKEMLNDPEHRVQLTAMIALAERGDTEMRKKMVDMYWVEATSDQERARIIMLVMDTPSSADFPLLSDALQRESTDAFTRHNVAHLFGRMGDKSVIAPLREAMAKSTDLAFNSLAEAAIQTIESRTKQQ